MPMGVYPRKPGVKHGPAKGYQRLDTRIKAAVRKPVDPLRMPSNCQPSVAPFKICVERRNGSRNTDEQLDIMERD